MVSSLTFLLPPTKMKLPPLELLLVVWGGKAQLKSAFPASAAAGTLAKCSAPLDLAHILWP